MNRRSGATQVAAILLAACGCRGSSAPPIPGPARVGADAATGAPATASATVAVTSPVPQPQHPDPGPVAAVLASARAERKAVVLEFSTKWCHPCQEFAARILPLPSVQAALGRVHFAAYDAEEGNGVAAASQYHVTSFPTFLVLDATGAVIATETGLDTSGDASFLRLVETAVIAAATEADVLASVTAAPGDAGAHLAAARWYVKHDRLADALPQLKRAAATASPALASEVAWDTMNVRRMSAVRAHAVADVTEFVRAYPASPHAAEALTFASVGTPIRPALRHELWTAILTAHAADSAALNELIYSALAAGELDAALVSALTLDGDPDLLDTLAEVHHYRGDRVAALASEDRAIVAASADARPSLVQNRARFADERFVDSPDVTAVRTRVAAFWTQQGTLAMTQDSPSSLEASELPAELRASLEAYMAAQTAAVAQVSRACARFAAGTPALDIVVSGDSTRVGGITVALSKPGAPAPLHACIDQEFAKITLPALPAGAVVHGAPVQLTFGGG